jgi:hypothetical protein
MSTTPNLGIALLAAAQSNKEVTVNTALVDLDAALCGSDYIVMTDADLTLASTVALENMLLVFEGTLSANRHIILPENAKPYIIVNNTVGSPSPYELLIKVGSGAVIATIPNDGNGHLVMSDGLAAVYKVS